jgi:hypothetical protein
MGKTGWMAFLLVVIVGGGINIAHITATDDAASNGKIEDVKEALLSQSSEILTLQGCEVTAQAVTRIQDNTENDILKVTIKNPTKAEVKFACNVRLDKSASSPFSRMAVSAPTTILKIEVSAPVPANSAVTKEIVVTSRTKTDNSASNGQARADAVKEQAWYTAYVIGKQPEDLKFACSWQQGITIKETVTETTQARK